MRIIAPSDYVVMPWKNGQGRTTQMYILPKQNLISEFDVRISVAHVGGSGPFSLFPGIDRILVQLTGSPMTVRHPGESGRIQLRHFEPYRFPGELETEATLEGEASDFNVMTRRGVFLADVNVHRMQARQEEFLTFGSDLTLLWAARQERLFCMHQKNSLREHGFRSVTVQ